MVAGACCGSTRSPIYVIGSGEGKTIADVWRLIADSVSAIWQMKVLSASSLLFSARMPSDTADICGKKKRPLSAI
jgi:hypothetical protein